MGKRLTVTLGGDLVLGRGVAEMIRRRGTAFPLAPIVPQMKATDLCLANLECAVTARDIRFSGAPKPFYFRAEPEAVETLTSAGVDLVSLANNHALDADYDGLRETLALLRERGIAWVGAGADREEARKPAVLWARESSVGVLAFCDHQPDFEAQTNRPGIKFVDLGRRSERRRLQDDLAGLARAVDHAIISCHWQPNWVPQVRPFYRGLARRFVESGASIVWGHSPHHFQGVEWFRTSAVIYSSGDLVTDYAVHEDFRNDLQLLFQVELGEEGVASVRALPLKLQLGRTGRAFGEDRAWIVERFSAMCGELGSRVQDSDGWLRVFAA